jgi:cell division protein FtsI/penicillin-binding protein 2
VVGIKLTSGTAGGFQATAGSPGGDAKQVTTAFLQAWSNGNLAGAANLTDNPAAARAALTTYAKDLNLRKVTGTATSAAAATAPKAPAGSSSKPTGAAASSTLETVGYQLNSTVAETTNPTAITGVWTSHPSLVAYQVAGGSGWYIEWRPSVVAPNLTASQHLATVIAPPQVDSVTDASGNQLTTYKDAGLTAVASLIQKDGSSSTGKPGLDVQLENAKNQAVGSPAATSAVPQNIAQISTTISPQAEAAAQTAVKQKNNSAMVVIQPSTGDILAIANNAGQNDYALEAEVAPGSDMKIITSTAVINNSLATASSSVQCQKAYTVQGVTYHNDENESTPAGTPFSTDFAMSCNNAFTVWWQQLQGTGSGTNKLATTAKEYYGLDQAWDIGIGGESAQYFDAPPTASGSELAEEDFGQGELTACPLAMASVAATVANGSFKQPIVVPGTKQLTATPLPATTKSQLWTMMHDVVNEPQGTAHGQGFASTVYAKTGTADVTDTGKEQPNAWFVAFDSSKDVAIADVVLNAGYGATNAAPEVKAFLSDYNG